MFMCTAQLTHQVEVHTSCLLGSYSILYSKPIIAGAPLWPARLRWGYLNAGDTAETVETATGNKECFRVCLLSVIHICIFVSLEVTKIFKMLVMFRHFHLPSLLVLHRDTWPWKFILFLLFWSHFLLFLINILLSVVYVFLGKSFLSYTLWST